MGWLCMPIIKYFNMDYDVTSPINIGGLLIDLTRAEEFRKEQGKLTEEGELARLYLDALPRPSPVVDPEGKYRNDGIDLATDDFNTIFNFIPQFPEVLRNLCRRVLSIRFPTEFNDKIPNLVDKTLTLEYELIRDTSSKTAIWLGECGFSGKFRLDGSIPNKQEGK